MFKCHQDKLKLLLNTILEMYFSLKENMTTYLMLMLVMESLDNYPLMMEEISLMLLLNFVLKKISAELILNKSEHFYNKIQNQLLQEESNLKRKLKKSKLNLRLVQWVTCNFSKMENLNQSKLQFWKSTMFIKLWIKFNWIVLTQSFEWLKIRNPTRHQNFTKTILNF